MKQITGGVTAALGFTAGGVHCGVKKSSSPDKKDLAMILSEKECTAAAVYTMNRVKAAPLYITMEHLEDGVARGIIANSGNANACAPEGHENAKRMCASAAAAVGLKENDFVVASTGVIGQTLNISAIEAGMGALAASLKKEGGSDDAAHAIMTTDTVKKELAFTTVIGGKTVTIGAIAKGSGMIHPNMATMLLFLTTDAAADPAVLQAALARVVPATFNQISVDGDTSTNDTVMLLASGLAGAAPLAEGTDDYETFVAALTCVAEHMCRELAGDGEGATKLLECRVTGAPDLQTARAVAKSVIHSTLFKAAMFGADANWGRVLCAIGYTPGDFDVSRTSVRLQSDAGEVFVCENAALHPYSEEEAAKVLAEREIRILVDLGDGEAAAKAWGCDLTYDYVKINGDYRT